VIDLRLVREHPDVVRASQRARGADESLVDALLAADEARRQAVKRADDLRAEQKAASQAVRTASPDERPVVLERAKVLAAQVKEAEEAQRAADAALREAHLAIPNVVHDGVPPGGEDDAVPLRTVGEVPAYDFPVRDHLEIGELLGAIDT
jgi:seryl-tRNA synthetase